MGTLIILCIGFIPTTLVWFISKRMRNKTLRFVICSITASVAYFGIALFISAILFMDGMRCFSHDGAVEKWACAPSVLETFDGLMLNGLYHILISPLYLVGSFVSKEIEIAIVIFISCCLWGFGTIFLIERFIFAKKN